MKLYKWSVTLYNWVKLNVSNFQLAIPYSDYKSITPWPIKVVHLFISVHCSVKKWLFFCGPTKCQELELYPRERKEIFVEHTVDGKNPAPVGNYWQLFKKVNNGIIVGQAIYQLIQDFFHPQYHTERIAPLSGLLLLLPSASRALSSAGLEPQVRFCEVPLPCTCPKMRDTHEIAISLETKR